MGWLIVGLSILMTSCGGSSPTAPRNVSLDEEFVLAPSQVAVVGDTGLTLSFERVDSDSRCAVDVVCVWEGDAAVALTASQSGREAAALELHTTTNGGGRREARYGDFVITLTAPVGVETWAILVAALVSLTATSIIGARTGRMNLRRTLARTLVVGLGTMAVSYLVGKLVF